MKEVLIVAHHFPPMGGPGSMRSVGFCKYLPTSGYRPTVLTITEEDVEHHFHPSDASMEELIEGLEIVRVPSHEPRRTKDLLRRLKLMRLAWFLLFPLFWESSALWPLAAFSRAKTLIEERNIELVYTSSSPYSSLLLGLLLKRRLGIKWVADLRDPYTDGYMWIWPSKIHWYVSRWVERLILRSPDRVIVNTNEVARLYLRKGLVDEERLVCITNGYLC